MTEPQIDWSNMPPEMRQGFIDWINDARPVGDADAEARWLAVRFGENNPWVEWLKKQAAKAAR